MYIEQQLNELLKATTNLEEQFSIFNMRIKYMKEQSSNNSNSNVNISALDELYTVSEAAKIMKTGVSYVYSLIKWGYLPVLKLGSYKIRRVALIAFLEKYEGCDLTDLSNPKIIDVTIK